MFTFIAFLLIFGAIMATLESTIKAMKDTRPWWAQILNYTLYGIYLHILNILWKIS